MTRPRAVVLDVNETLFSLDSLGPVFDALGLPGLIPLWFSRTLRNGFALTCASEYRTFPEVAAGALRSLAPDQVGDQHVDALLSAFGQLQVHPEVPEAMALLGKAGIPAVTLSVGNADNVRRLFAAAGLDDVAVDHLSCSSVRRWKPAPEPYLFACERLAQAPADVWMVAAHAWDIAGAAAVGMRTAWLARLEGEFDTTFGSPDVQGADLLDVVQQLVSR